MKEKPAEHAKFSSRRDFISFDFVFVFSSKKEISNKETFDYLAVR